MKMNDYKLYKGAWVYLGKPHEETCLTSQQIKELLKRGGGGVIVKKY